MISISRIDHIVLTVNNIPTTIDFYVRVLGMHADTFADNRVALKFGQQKINLHQAGNEFEPKAQNSTPGSADLCLVTDTDLTQAIKHVQNCKAEIIEGPVERTGANEKLLSFYIRDPDQNLIEVAKRI